MRHTTRWMRNGVAVAASLLACSAQPRDPQRAQPHRAQPHENVPDGSASRTPPRDRPPKPSAAVPPRERPLPDGYLAFPRACDEGPVVTIAAVGDLLLHHELQIQAYAAPDRFRNLWHGIADLLARADVTYANLEVPIATGITRRGKLVPDPGLRFDNRVYSGYARFNAHPSLAQDLVLGGFDVVSTANNHALDRGSLGIDRTLDALDTAGLRHTGTRRRGTSEPWHTVTQAQGLNIAWLACTLHTNFGKDVHDQVLHCFREKGKVARHVAKLAGDPQIDAVIVTPHFGKEYDPVPSKRQRAFTHAVLDAGATAVIGSHPHVLQPWERYRTKDGRETFAMYSLGNFASHQRELPRRTSILLVLGLRKTDDGTVRPVGAGYIPLHVRMEGDMETFYVEAIDRAGGPADARALVADMFGPLNVLDPEGPFDVTPQCNAEWAGWQ